MRQEHYGNEQIFGQVSNSKFNGGQIMFSVNSLLSLEYGVSYHQIRTGLWQPCKTLKRTKICRGWIIYICFYPLIFKQFIHIIMFIMIDKSVFVFVTFNAWNSLINKSIFLLRGHSIIDTYRYLFFIFIRCEKRYPSNKTLRKLHLLFCCKKWPLLCSSGCLVTFWKTFNICAFSDYSNCVNWLFETFWLDLNL